METFTKIDGKLILFMAKPNKKTNEAFNQSKEIWIAKYRGPTDILEKTDNRFTFMDFPEKIRKIRMVSNTIERFKGKLKNMEEDSLH